MDKAELKPPTLIEKGSEAAPANRGEVTVADVHGAATPEEHAERVWRWGRSVWEAWSKYHEWAIGYLENFS